MNGVAKSVGVIFVLGLYIYCYGQNTIPDEHGLIMTTYTKYYYGRQDIVQLYHLPVYPGYENFSSSVPGIKVKNQNVHFTSVDIDYRTRCLYMYDTHFRSVVLGTGYNKDLKADNMTFYPMHVGVSRGKVQVAVDWLSHTVYWSDSTFRWIVAAPGQKDKINMDYYKIIADKHLDAPGGITVDPLEGYLFWSDISKIERSNLGGKERHTIVSKHLKTPLSIEADIFEKRIYWIDSSYETVLSSTYDGEDVLSLPKISQSTLYDLAVFREVVYISDVKNGNVYTLNKTKGVHFGKQESTTISIYREIIYGLAVYGSEHQPLKDKDYCSEKNCEHLCVSTKSGAECLCAEGYLLVNETGKCNDTGKGFHKAIVVANATHICLLDIRSFVQSIYLYVCKYTVPMPILPSAISTTYFPRTSTPSYYRRRSHFLTRPSRATVSTTPATTVIPLYKIKKLDMDMENRIVYFATDDNTIYGRPIDLPIENDAVEEVVSAAGNISGLAYDGGDTNNLYWCEYNTGIIRVVNVVTKASKQVIADKNSLIDPRDIVVLLKHRRLAVLTGRRYRISIQTMTMEGTDIKSAIGDKTDITSFTFDNENDLFYYTYGGYLYSIGYSGGSATVASYSVDRSAHSLVKYQHYISWVYGDVYVKTIDAKTRGTVRYGLFGNVSATIVDMKVMDSRLQLTNVSSPCANENGGCSHICITKYTNDEMTLVCECRLGYSLAEDGVTCQSSATAEDNFIIATDTTNAELLSINLDTKEISAIPISMSGSYRGVYFDARSKKIIWAFNYDDNIYSANLNGTDIQIVSDLARRGYAYRFDKDMSTGNLYFTSYYGTSIDVITQSGDFISLHSLYSWYSLGDIVVHPGKGWLFFTANGYYSNYIGRLDMNGENIMEIVTGDDVDQPDGLAIDFNNNHLYWSDATYDTIQRCSLDGYNCVTIVNMTGTYQQEEIRDLETDGVYLYYTAYRKDHIVRVNLTEPYDRTVVGQSPGVGKLNTITFYSSQNKNVQPESSACRARNGLGDCSTVCYPTPTGRSCGCPNDISLKVDGRTCSNIYQCTDLIEQTVSLSQGTEEVIDVTFAQSCLRYIDDECHYKCPVNFEPVFNTSLTCTNVGWNLESETLCKEIRCPVNIKNGTLDSKCNREVGNTCNFQCDKGFTKATDLVICLKSGVYQMSENEFCIPYMCDERLENGRVDEKCTKELGASCNYSCSDYYTKVINHLEISCKEDGWIPDPSMLCKQSMCSDIYLPNGVVTGNCQKNVGSACEIQCDKGYVNTTAVAVCQSNLMWHPADSCTPVTCPAAIPNGNISGSCDFTVGATCKFKCSKGFSADKLHDSVTCKANGQWNLNPCIELACSAVIINGKLNPKCNRVVGEICNFTCNDDFTPTTDTVVCTTNGTFHGPESDLCQPFICNSSIGNGTLERGCSRTIGSSCKYKCNKYFTPTVNNMEIICQADGWMPGSTDLCKESMCTDSSLTNGMVTGNCQKKVGSVCTIQCDKGYVNTTDVAVCKSNLMWHPKEACTAVTCPTNVPNGSIVDVCNYAIGTTCKFQCSDGFRSDYFHENVTCNANGQWNLSPCIEFRCAASINNGKLSTKCNRVLGEVCNFTCNDGFIPTAETAVCTQNGTFHDPQSDLCRPFRCNENIDNGALADGCLRTIDTSCKYKCNKYFTPTVDNGETTCQADGWNPRSSGLCKGRNSTEFVCEDSLPNGKLADVCRNEIGETCTVQCNQGYINTTDKAVCKADLLWHPRDSCTAFKCDETIENGTLDAECLRTIGTSCKFSCNKYFTTKVTNMVLTCHTDGWNPKTANLCEEFRCAASINNGKLSTKCNRVIGEICNITCNDGFLPTAETAVCTKNGTFHDPQSDLCRPFRCNERIDNGALADGCLRTIDTSCKYKCNKYFTPTVDNAETTCQADGWNPRSSGLCKEFVCEDSLPNGKLADDCRNEIGETCTVQCNQGFLNTTYKAVCKADLLWHPRDSCTAFKCDETIENGNLDADCLRTIGTTCKFSCSKYFTTKVTNMVLTCHTDGWNPKSTNLCEESVCRANGINNGKIVGKCSMKVGNPCMFQCDEGYVNTTDSAICKNDYTWHPREPCTVLKCPASIPNGDITGVCDRIIGSTCSFKCHDDFTPNNTRSQIACNNNWQWDHADEGCLELTCEDASLANGKVTGKCTKTVGETCNFNCDKGYTKTIDLTVCKNDYIWHPHNACSQRNCQPFIRNGKIAETCDLSIGSTCNFTCNDGFTAADLHASITCNNTGHWDTSDDLCLVTAKISVTETLRDNGLSVSGVASGISVLGLVIIVLVVAMVFLFRRNTSSTSTKSSFHGGRDTAFENPGYLHKIASSVNTTEEQPTSCEDSNIMQTAFIEEAAPVDDRVLDQIYNIEPLPDVAQMEATDDTVILTHESWRKEREKIDSKC